MTASHGGSPARKALIVLTALIVAGGALVTGSPAHAAARPTATDPDNPDGLPTFAECSRTSAKGRMYGVVPVGPGQVLVVGSVRPCRAPRVTDSAIIADVTDEIGRPASGNSYVFYRRKAGTFFARIVTLSADTRRVCLADTPEHAVDCYAVRVPERDGKLGTPVVHGHTTTADVRIESYYGFCGSCW